MTDSPTTPAAPAAPAEPDALDVIETTVAQVIMDLPGGVDARTMAQNVHRTLCTAGLLVESVPARVRSADPQTGGWADQLAHVYGVLSERAPTDIDIGAGTTDAPWWLSLRDAIDRLDDIHRAAAPNSSACPEPKIPTYDPEGAETGEFDVNKVYGPMVERVIEALEPLGFEGVIVCADGREPCAGVAVGAGASMDVTVQVRDAAF